ncbi:MAG: hypothetical protein ACRC6E_02090, partial [Fusobacteriaceae bacterium]
INNANSSNVELKSTTTTADASNTTLKATISDSIAKDNLLKTTITNSTTSDNILKATITDSVIKNNELKNEIVNGTNKIYEIILVADEKIEEIKDLKDYYNLNSRNRFKQWLGTVTEFNLINNKEQETFYNYFDEEGAFVGSYYKQKPKPVQQGLLCWYDFADGKGVESFIADRVNPSDFLTLQNFGFDENSGWTGKGLLCDGINDLWFSGKLQSLVDSLGNNFTFQVIYEIPTGGTKHKQAFSFLTDMIRLGIENESFGFNKNIFKQLPAPTTRDTYTFSRNNEVFTFSRKEANNTADLSTLCATWNNNYLLSKDVLRTLSNSIYSKTLIHSIKIYNRTLTEEELTHNYEYEQTIDRNTTQMLPDNSQEISYGIGNSSQLSEEQKLTFRLSNDKTKFVSSVRYLDGLEYVGFTYADIQKEMLKEEWVFEEIEVI